MIYYILGIITGIILSVLLMIGQFLLSKKGIEIEKPLKKVVGKNKIILINPKKEEKIKKMLKEL